MLLHFSEPAKLKTKRILFQDAYIASDSSTIEHLKELSSRRRAIEESINQSRSITEAIAREMSGGLTSHSEQDLQKLENYIPLLKNLVYHVDLIPGKTAKRTSNLKIQWTSALSTLSFFDLVGSNFFQIDNLNFELSMILFLYGAILRERALEVMPADLVQSALLFRKASGVYHYLAREVLPSLGYTPGTNRPLEIEPSTATAMSLICLAEAQAVAIRKAEEKEITASLLAKLHYGITCFLGEATNECRCGPKDLNPRFLDFISSCGVLHRLRSQKYFAESLKTSGKVGIAIKILLQSLTDAKSKMPGEDSWRSVFRQEIDSVSKVLRKFKYENEFVWREHVLVDDVFPVPEEGKKIVKSIAYQPIDGRESLHSRSKNFSVQSVQVLVVHQLFLV